MTSSTPSDSRGTHSATDASAAPSFERPGIDYSCFLPASSGAALGLLCGAVLMRPGGNRYAGALIWSGAMMTTAAVRCESMKARRATFYDPPLYDSTKSWAVGIGIIPALQRIAVVAFPRGGEVESPARILYSTALFAAGGACIGFVADWIGTQWPEKPPPRIDNAEDTRITQIPDSHR